MAPVDEIAAALAGFQSEVPVIPKGKTARIQTERGRDYAYTYADLAAVAAVVMPLLAKHGLSFTATPKASKDGPPTLVGHLLHTSGQRLTGELPITGRTPQEIGSSLTYGRRYLLGCLTGVVTDDDDDGTLATRAARKRGVEDSELPPVAPPIQRQRRPRKVAGGSAPVSPPDTSSPHGPTDPGAEADPPPHGNPDDAMTDPQRRAMFAAIGKAMGPDAQRWERLALCSAIVGRRLESSADMTNRDVSLVLGWLDDYLANRVSYVTDHDTQRVALVVTAPVPDEDEPPDPELFS